MKKIFLFFLPLLFVMVATANAKPILVPYIDDVKIVEISSDLKTITAKVKVVNPADATFTSWMDVTLFNKGASPDLDRTLANALLQAISVPANSYEEFEFIFKPVYGIGDANTPLYVTAKMMYPETQITGRINRAALFPGGEPTATSTMPASVTVTNPSSSKIIWTDIDLEGVSTNLTDTGTPSSTSLSDTIRIVSTFRNEGGIEGKVDISSYDLLTTAGNMSLVQIAEKNRLYSIPPGTKIKIFFDVNHTFDFSRELSVLPLTDILDNWRNQIYTGYMHMKNSFYSYSKPVSYSDLQAPTMTTTTIPAPEPTTTSVPKPLPTTTLRPVTPMRFSLVIGVQVGKPEGISFYPSKTAIIPSPSLNYMPIRLVRNGRTVAQATTNTRGLAALSGVMAGDTLLISNARTGVLFRDFWKFDIPAPAWGAMVTLAPIIQKPIIKPILR